jgi:DNA primase
MPVAWSEVTLALTPRSYTVKDVRRRLDAVGDLARPLLTGGYRLGPALDRLRGR